MPLTAAAQSKEVVFLGFGGTHEKNLKERAIPAFEKKYGVKVIYVSGTMAANFARAQAQKGRPEADVLWNNDIIHVIGKKMGLFEKLDPARVPSLKDVYDVAMAGDDELFGNGGNDTLDPGAEFYDLRAFELGYRHDRPSGDVTRWRG